MDDGSERGALVLLDETPVADVLEPSVGDVGGDLLHGVEAEVAAVGEDRGQQRADLAGVDPLARLLEVDAEPEVVLDLDEQVGEPDRAVAGIQPAVQLGEAVRLRRVGLLGRVRLEPPPVVVERDLPVVSDTFQEAVERVREPLLQALDRRAGVAGESGPRPERIADLLPLRGGQEEGLEPAEVLRAVDGEVAGLDLVAHLEEQRALPAPTVGHAVAADERLQRRRREVERCVGRDAAASRRAVFPVDPQRRQGRRGALALLVDELHPAQKRRGELVQPGVSLGRLLEAGLPVAPRPVRQVGLVLVQLRSALAVTSSGAFGALRLGVGVVPLGV